MIIDSSAIVAILFQEAGYEKLAQKIVDASDVGIGTATLVETGIVLSARLGKDARPLLTRFLAETGISAISLQEIHFGLAVGAWLKYGKGRHPAALNFGDCLSYAVAKAARVPLLCVGEDFPQTDIKLA